MRADASSIEASDIGWLWQALKPGLKYRVCRAFTDADGDAHSVGEEWQLRNCSFDKFDDEVTVFVTKTDGTRWSFRLTWSSCTQGDTIERPMAYLDAVNV